MSNFIDTRNMHTLYQLELCPEHSSVHQLFSIVHEIGKTFFRYQRMIIDDQASSWTDIKAAVPQG